MDVIKNRIKISKLFAALSTKIFIYVLLIGLSFVFLYPYLYMLSTSFKSYSDIMNVFVKWIPRKITLDNYILAYKAINFNQSFANSIFVAVMATIGHVASCSFVGYGFARFNFKFKGVIFAIIIFSILVPVQTIIIPLYFNYSSLKMIDSFLPFIVPSFLAFGYRGGLYVFLFYQYFIRYPKSLEEAAEIDGCTPIKTFFRIALPSSGAIIIVTMVLSMVWHWNDYYEPSLYLTPSGKTSLLPQMIPQMYSMIESLANTTDKNLLELKTKYHEGVTMAGTFLATMFLPVMYFVLQKRFIEGIETSGLTGE